VRNRLLSALLAALVVLGLAACGGEESSGSSDGGGDDTLVVSAASSLTDAFEAYGDALGGDVRFSFAGSDDLAAQIRQGVKPDVFAAANTRLPDQLHAEGLVGRPVVFASNSLVIAVPAGDAQVRGIADLAKPGTTIAIGAAEVPIGSYTREVLSRLGAAPERAILANVRSEEPDVKGIVGKLTQGAVDAGFVYVTDVAAAGDDLRAIPLPASLQPRVAYGAAVVEGAEQPAAARRFVAGLLRGEGAQELRAAGFEPPPAGG
jgi:molybdate transport system substrate-binding protein